MSYGKAGHSQRYDSAEAERQPWPIADPARRAGSVRLKVPGSLRPSRERSPAQPGAPDPAGLHKPMLWTGANARGSAVFGVAASPCATGSVEVAALIGRPGESRRLMARSLSVVEARELARHLMTAAEEAERREAMQLVATA